MKLNLNLEHVLKRADEIYIELGSGYDNYERQNGEGIKSHQIVAAIKAVVEAVENAFNTD